MACAAARVCYQPYGGRGGRVCGCAARPAEGIAPRAELAGLARHGAHGRSDIPVRHSGRVGGCRRCTRTGGTRTLLFSLRWERSEFGIGAMPLSIEFETAQRETRPVPICSTGSARQMTTPTDRGPGPVPGPGPGLQCQRRAVALWRPVPMSYVRCPFGAVPVVAGPWCGDRCEPSWNSWGKSL